MTSVRRGCAMAGGVSPRMLALALSMMLCASSAKEECGTMVRCWVLVDGVVCVCVYVSMCV